MEPEFNIGDKVRQIDSAQISEDEYESYDDLSTYDVVNVYRWNPINGGYICVLQRHGKDFIPIEVDANNPLIEVEEEYLDRIITCPRKMAEIKKRRQKDAKSRSKVINREI